MPNPKAAHPAAFGVTREFHVSKDVRSRYTLEETFFSNNGNVIFANFRAARRFAQKINEQRDVATHPERAVSAGELNAMGLVDEILHHIISQYRRQRNPRVLGDALRFLEAQLGQRNVEKALRTFVEQFPPIPVQKGKVTPVEYLKGQTDGEPHRQAVLEEMLLLWLNNENPASAPFLELFDDEGLTQETAYPKMMEEMEAFLSQSPTFGPEDQSLYDMLRSPAQASPESWSGQLTFIRSRWAPLLGEYLTRLLSSLDFLEEEAKAFFGFGPGPAHVLEFEGAEAEPENFSPDLDWMPRAVMIAKNVYVWLDQMSKSYGHQIRQLDQIPDAELDRLRRYGFTALWLIGLWERSEASKRIKQMMGNPDAVASAYSIKEYRIADDLGGEPAFEDLKSRAWSRGIRMASDMVPNHVGIDSDWVVNHPDWFIRLDHSPFPSYSFSGVDLCDDGRVGVYLEDHYYDRTDAAVVFQRRDHWTGDATYIYHGNDGTQMPWNDTAQLDYLNPEVREAVIQTILAVARRSPIIRFDAAMTLAKRHYQRLWYPEPGTGGDIPSRAEHGLSTEAFNERMPEEFWREVVDRVAVEAPDTLLLAEAFWMMEGYFVRSLGMHRVYNSAFMNMLRDEKNDEYRQVIKNTLAFDPEILRRFVNFQNNPDEKTAIEQFGDGDKYFGVCTLMVTMPGLPMFGHGQIQGFSEKYGMEFRHAYWDEQPDQDLIARHEREIFPLAHRRHLFAGVDDFRLYDFVTASGDVDENVFAYSNRIADERVLILYHNRFGDTRGRVRVSAPYAVKGSDGEKSMVTTTLSEALGISDDAQRFLIFRDATRGLEYLRNCRELAEQGFYAELWAYQTYVFLDFHEVQDDEAQHYAQLAAYLQGGGVPSIDEALRERIYGAVLAPYRMLVSAPAFEWLMGGIAPRPSAVDKKLLEEVTQKVADCLAGARAIVPEERVVDAEADEETAEMVVAQLQHVLSLSGILRRLAEADEADAALEAAVDYLLSEWDVADPELWGGLFGWLFTCPLGAVVDLDHPAEASRDWFDAWLLRKPLDEALEGLDVPAEARERVLATVRMLLTQPSWLPTDVADEDETAREPYGLMRRALEERAVQAYLSVNRYEDVLWYRAEAFDAFLWWIVCLAAVRAAPDGETALIERLRETHRWVKVLQDAAQDSDYQIGKLLTALQA